MIPVCRQTRIRTLHTRLPNWSIKCVDLGKSRKVQNNGKITRCPSANTYTTEHDKHYTQGTYFSYIMDFGTIEYACIILNSKALTRDHSVCFLGGLLNLPLRLGIQRQAVAVVYFSLVVRLATLWVTQTR